jgi:hypothetical protein
MPYKPNYIEPPRPDKDVDWKLSDKRSAPAKEGDGKKHASNKTFHAASPRETIITGSETEVNVKLMGDTDTHQVWISVFVKSRIRPGLWNSITHIDPDSPSLPYLVQHAAEELANYQCKHYQDVHNPVAVGKVAVEALRDIKEAAEISRRGRGKGT